MSTIDPGTLWTALQAVDDGETPEDVYARVMNESADPEEAIQEAVLDDLIDTHSHKPCRDKHADFDICWGSECERVNHGVIHKPCPCRCHDDGSPWND